MTALRTMRTLLQRQRSTAKPAPSPGPAAGRDAAGAGPSSPPVRTVHHPRAVWCWRYQHPREWRSRIGGHVVCATCHPPADVGHVAEWLEAPQTAATWPNFAAALIDWFHQHRDQLPREPFVIVPGIVIQDVPQWAASLEADIAAGPHGARALGLLQDLTALQSAMAGRLARHAQRGPPADDAI